MSNTGKTQASVEAGQRIITLQELAQYDGKKGAPGYIAIKGIVYDVSNVHLLKNGLHHNVTPGNDVTNLFVHAPGILKRLTIVGKLG